MPLDPWLFCKRPYLMNFTRLLLALFAFTSAHAQDAHPKLAPLKSKYETDAKALAAERDEAAAKARAVYERALAGAERAATDGRDVKTAAAIGKERQAATDGRMAPAFPADLPGALQGPRRDYLAALAKAAAEVAPRRQKLDAEYLAQIARIDAGGDAELAKQLAAEKQRMLGAAGNKTAATSESLAGKRSVIVNGDFSLGDPGSAPKGWEAAYPGGSAKIVPDGKNQILRLEMDDNAKNVGVKQDVAVPPNARSATFRARMRGKPKNAKTENRAEARITLRITDAKGQPLPYTIITSKHSIGWQNEQRTVDLPPGAKSIEVVASSIFAEGTFDFDDVSLDFK
jgi:hypothetical protein